MHKTLMKTKNSYTIITIHLYIFNTIKNKTSNRGIPNINLCCLGDQMWDIITGETLKKIVIILKN